MKKLKQKNILSVTVSALMTLIVCQSVSVQASDIDIYSTSTNGKTSILMMLDTSGSMGISSLVLPNNNQYGSPGDVTRSLCEQTGVVEAGDSNEIKEWKYNAIDNRTGSATNGKTSFVKTVIVNSNTKTYYLRGCGNPTINTSGKLIESATGKFDRLSRLKDALIQLLADTSISNDTYMGLGHFSSRTPITVGSTTNKLVDGHSGKILVPVAQLTAAQRERIINELIALKSVDTTTDENGNANANLKLSSTAYPNIFKASSGTPTAHAYAEAAAYMMGTTTGQDPSPVTSSQILYDGYSVMQKTDDPTKQIYFICVGLDTTGANPTALGAAVKACDNQWNNNVIQSWTLKQWRDSNTKSVNSQAVIYKPDGAGGWTQITAAALKAQVGEMTTDWQTIEKLPVGWRYGGWMKVANEPMDIEPIGGQVWGTNVGARNLVSYRSSPFSMKSTPILGTGKCTQTSSVVARPYSKTYPQTGGSFQACPSGYSILTEWNSLCYKNGNWTRAATNAEVNAGQCLAPVEGTAPLYQGRSKDGSVNNNENYNKSSNVYPGGGGLTYTALTPSTVTPVDNNYGGFAYSASDTKKTDGSNTYKAGGSIDICDGNGIYFLTDGAPNSTKDSMAQAIMNKTLDDNAAYTFTAKPTGTGTLQSPTLTSGLFTGETGGWEYIGEYAKKLRNRTDISNTKKNPKDMNIKTAVVGFGSSFSGLTKNADGSYDCDSALNDDAKNACLWGSKGYGDGGFFYAENSDDIKQSIINFVKNVTPPFNSVVTGSPTLPQDALNLLRIQPYGYYTEFTPTPQSTIQLWVGNLNKYHVVNGELYDNTKTIKLIKSDGSLDSTATGIWGVGGMKGQLPLRFGINADNVQVANRKIYTNRKITGSTTFTATEDNSLNKVNVDALFSVDGTGKFVDDPQKNYWLNLLGYNVGANDTVTLADVTAKPELRQLGANMHSTPLLLTQSGKITVDANGNPDTTDRDDYLLFGTTQGLLHIVHAGKSATDTNRGKEVFSFVPNEMMVNQREAFLSEGGSSAGGSAHLFYGIDAPWTAYTQYISKADGTLTVNDSGRTIKETADGDDIALKGLQWVYGGLRMGGRSYYALDLSDIDSPKLKFHIDPENSKIYKSSSTTPADVSALSYMGQSWSKPTIAYVKFGGVKRLVMFVGGGYDSSYENANYDQNTTTQGGAGVYMFDANSGDLLWWTSANATAAMGAESYTNASASSINMKYSVVSQINAIDRDNDGLVDHLYFGDLGGQAFRVDIDNAAEGANASAKKGNFIAHVVRLFDQHASGGASPRFYEMPSFSIHDGDNGYVGVVALSSGNRSSPLSGAAGTNQAGLDTSATDGVFVVYDKDVAKSGLYALSDSISTTELTTKNITLISLNDHFSTGVAISGNNGWKYSYSDTAGRYKGMNGLYALDGILFVNVFDRDGTGINSSTCGGGVKGDSYVYQFCLPTGKCPADYYSTGQTGPNRTKLGGGILGTGLGQGSNTGDSQRLIVNRDSEINCITTPNLPECQQFSTKAKIRQLRWYETR